MKAQFIVTIEGSWLENGKTVTTDMAEKRLREAAKEGFQFLANRVTVKRHKEAKHKRTRNADPDVMTDAEVFADQLAQM